MPRIGPRELAIVLFPVIVLAPFVASIILTITGARKHRRPEGGSSIGLIIGIIYLVLSACLGCSLLVGVLAVLSGQM
ncbi:MAG: hypothetical protein MUQ10_12825 [Anaerolineae bacterium]|nr:hypothetical protein [Anaerolineae bacterium]